MKIIDASLLIGFLFVDFLFFHDIFKAGETTSFAQYLTGLLSLPVMMLAIRDLIKPSKV